jgi:hypothetical protein
MERHAVSVDSTVPLIPTATTGASYWPRRIWAMMPIISLTLLVACGAPATIVPAQATQTAAVAVTQISGTAAAVSTVVGTATDLRQT